MKILLFVVVSLAFVVLAIVLISAILNRFFNIVALSRKPRITEASEMENGLIFNVKDNKLEADQSAITPF